MIGGAQIFRNSIEHDACRLFYLTKIGVEKECDTFLPEGFLKPFRHIESSETVSENNIAYNYTKYLNKNFQGQFVHTENEFPI